MIQILRKKKTLDDGVPSRMQPAMLRPLAKDSCLSRNEAYLYVPIGKAANTNIKRWLWEAEYRLGHSAPPPEPYFGVHNGNWKLAEWGGASPWVAFTPDNYRSFWQSAKKAKKKFTVVRNPYIRLVSGYRDKIERRKLTIEEAQIRFLLSDIPKSFGDFVDMILTQPDSKTNVHFRSQSYCSAFRFLDYDRIFKVEDENSILELPNFIFGDRYDKPVERKSIHASKAGDFVYDYLDAEIISKINERFRYDFIHFGYEMLS